ncbi:MULTISPECIES: cytochrome c biogenesis protein ResB [Bacillaceae]|uniref:Cytochrome c biogenesis protein ResB n=1 Tax=Halalkalibacter alkaliphilus TaxID=2917993 RepID=A0A9X1ZW80_9BACI|nr:MULTISPECIES: cytochrome c biogenesis protein ResB [Bacillaceae]MCL7746664.1 cytochrome c biogenesis protein ResB [Halalkalibacter alkaliphilus]MDT8860496.1 cytochrome c biogenesis protein ResB [Alkalihalobacillus sp. MEB130]
MNNLSCSCGQQNPQGTDLCGGCGKPLVASENQQVLNMRYEGAARRSQTYNKTIVDQIWNFFSSVKVGIWIIVILLLASSLGTILPQEMYIPPAVNPAEYYQDQYGFLGQVYYELGFHNLYQSWWYLLLMAALTVSLIIASVDRFFPLYRSLKHQRVHKHINFMKKQRLVSETQLDKTANTEKWLNSLKGKKYNVRTDGTSILAEKGRFARWGPYVNHIGLIIFLIGGMLRFFPGMFVDHHLWVREGDTEVIPGTNGEYYLENHQFIVELYDENDELFQTAIDRAGGVVVKTYQTNVTLYQRNDDGPVGSQRDLQEVDSYQIRVNDPFKFDGFGLYQVDYKLHELNKMMFTVENDETGEMIGEFTVDLFYPEQQYDLPNDYYVKLQDYLPDYYLNNDGIPSTKSRIPDNPAFIFEVNSPNQEKKEVSFLTIGRNFDPTNENVYSIRLSDLETKHVSALIVRKDYTLPILVIGGFIFMIGLVQGSYWTHRRIWIQEENGKVMMAGHTNKNWYAFKREMAEVAKEAELEQPVDRTEDK